MQRTLCGQYFEKILFGLHKKVSKMCNVGIAIKFTSSIYLLLGLVTSLEVFENKANLKFLYITDIEGFKRFHPEIKLCLIGDSLN